MEQPKFRGFSLGKSSNSSNDAAASIPAAAAAAVTDNEDKTENAANTDVINTSRSRRSSRSMKNSASHTSTTTATATSENVVETRKETTTVQRDIKQSFVKSTPANGGALGLTERYQERMRTRIRGAGAHKSDFKGFTLKDIKSGKPAVEQAEQADQADQVDQAERSGRRTTAVGMDTKSAAASADKGLRRTKSTPGSSNTTPLPSTADPRRSTAGSQESTLSLKDMLAQPSTTIPISSNSRMTRAASRYTGQSPSFKLAWGKTLVVSETRRQEAAQARENGMATPAAIAPRAVTTPATQAPVEDNNAVDGLDGFDDFGDDGMPPTLARDTPAPESERVREDFPAKRKSSSIITPETTSTATDTTTATRKPSLALTKRRRLIQEEADENEEPLLSIEGLPMAAMATPKDSVYGRTTKPTITTKESMRDQSTKESVTATKVFKAPTDIISRDTSTKKSGQTDGKKSKSTSSSTTKPTRTTQESTKQKSTIPLKQTTLMQLNGSSSKKDVEDRSTSLAARSRGVADDDSEDDRVFEKKLQKQMSKATSRKSSSRATAARKRKGPSSDTVKNYQQLQINCLKFFGPAAAIAKPATVKNKAIGKKLSDGVDDEEAVVQGKRSVQSILHIERAPLSEMDVIADAVRDVVDDYIDSVEDQTMMKDLRTLRSELETRLIEQVDMLDDHSLLRASVKKAAAVKKELRVQLLETQRRRQKTRQELAKVRADFEREERVRHRLEETHKFLTDLESLRDEVVGSDGEGSGDDDSGGKTGSSPHDNVKTGLHSYIATVGARSGGAGAQDGTDTRPGMLGALVEFNRLLETMVKNTPTKSIVSGSDSDSSDYEL
ncbi:hypothetical protein BG015_010407 [Linnemannia schmuckeri]|uniref:Inner kinetochore subunit AME1 domain-containing protein n=1 Tax=Linnemannia schmuckeri TaxID=64567 RepID=A0A9P5VEK2_9FUNG|nr:hypothetical protein BG015_010407 [Linnemannia schmuckeri]